MQVHSLYRADPGNVSLVMYSTSMVPQPVCNGSVPFMRPWLILLPGHTAPNRFPVLLANILMPSSPLGGIPQ